MKINTFHCFRLCLLTIGCFLILLAGDNVFGEGEEVPWSHPVWRYHHYSYLPFPAVGEHEFCLFPSQYPPPGGSWAGGPGLRGRRWAFEYDRWWPWGYAYMAYPFSFGLTLGRDWYNTCREEFFGEYSNDFFAIPSNLRGSMPGIIEANGFYYTDTFNDYQLNGKSPVYGKFLYSSENPYQAYRL